MEISDDAIVLAAATIFGAIIAAGGVGWFLGLVSGRKGKIKKLGELITEHKFNDTKWNGVYKDIDEKGEVVSTAGTIKLMQDGSRIVGTGISEGHEWNVEGVIYKGKIIYIYISTDNNVTSMGTATLEVSSDGKTLSGEWIGWAGDVPKKTPQEISFERFYG